MKVKSKKPVIIVMIFIVIYWSIISYFDFNKAIKSVSQNYKQLNVKIQSCSSRRYKTHKDYYCYVIDPETHQIRYVRVNNESDYRNGTDYTMYKYSDGTIEEPLYIHGAMTRFIINIVCIILALNIITISIYNELRPIINNKIRVKKQIIFSIIFSLTIIVIAINVRYSV